MPDFAYLDKEILNLSNSSSKLFDCKITNKQRRQLQHEFKIHIEQYLKNLLGKGANTTRVTIWCDMVLIQGENFLTDPEKYIISTPNGCEAVNNARRQIRKQYLEDNLSYFEETLGAKCIHQALAVDSANDYWMHLMVFDQLLIDL